MGAGAGAVVAATRTEDLFGFRHGFLLPSSGRGTCCAVQGKGRDYSNEIYTADLKLQGVARRAGIGIGPLRYLLVSITYGTKGYPSGVPELRERQVGIEILDDLRVTRSTWWATDCTSSSTTSGFRTRASPSATISIATSGAIPTTAMGSDRRRLMSRWRRSRHGFGTSPGSSGRSFATHA